MRKTLLFLCGCIFLVLYSCEDFDFNPEIDQDGTASSAWQTFVIPKDKHYTTTIPEHISWNRNYVHFQVRFNSSAIYTTVDSLNQADVNKLYGFTDCNNEIHENSVRFGWNYNPSQAGSGTNLVNLFSYVYKNQVRTINYMTSVPLDSAIDCEIYIKSGMYFLTIEDLYKDTLMAGCISAIDQDKTTARPYFGGDETAPDTVKIEIRVLANDSI